MVRGDARVDALCHAAEGNHGIDVRLRTKSERLSHSTVEYRHSVRHAKFHFTKFLKRNLHLYVLSVSEDFSAGTILLTHGENNVLNEAFLSLTLQVQWKYPR